jgi:hypothetical protein
VDVLDQRLAPGEDPLVHDIARKLRLGIVLEVDAVILLEDGDVSGEEVVRVEPGKEDSGQNTLDPLLLEEKVVTSNDGGVDKEETDRVKSMGGR